LLISANSGKPAVQMFTHSYGTHAHDEFEQLRNRERMSGDTNPLRKEVTPELVRSTLPEIISMTLEPVGGLGIFAASQTYREAASRDVRVIRITDAMVRRERPQREAPTLAQLSGLQMECSCRELT
jgi:hypothetical protein